MIENPERSFWGHFVKGFFGVLTVISGLIFYFVANDAIITIKHISLTSYKNINQMGHTNLKMMMNGIVSAWKDFFVPTDNMYMSSVRGAYYVAIFLTVAFLIWHMVDCWKKNRVTLFFLTGGALCFPVGVNLLYLMGDISGYHGIMLYAKVMVFILPLALAEKVQIDMVKIKKYSMLCLSLLLVYVGIFYTHFANVCYLQAEFQQKEAISWMNTLVTRIQSEEGYSRNLPIAWLNGEGQGHEVPAATTTLLNMPDVGMKFAPYGASFSNWKTAMFYWCGFSHEEIAETSEIESMQEVQDMPSYPDAGSVRIINGVIVVKFMPKSS